MTRRNAERESWDRLRDTNYFIEEKHKKHLKTIPQPIYLNITDNNKNITTN